LPHTTDAGRSPAYLFYAFVACLFWRRFLPDAYQPSWFTERLRHILLGLLPLVVSTLLRLIARLVLPAHYSSILLPLLPCLGTVVGYILFCLRMVWLRTAFGAVLVAWVHSDVRLDLVLVLGDCYS
jgi:hypothetical protein